MQVEWDEDKNDANILKHRVDFETASRVFEDPLRTDTQDDREDYGEERWVSTGYAGPRLLTVVYVERSGILRLISAWKSTREERRAYESAQSSGT
ncbi:BrnT family toxin [Candidatus Poribacteria bacterium]|nr:BrnT family toxin [Candidatus Poribacteria bacterium]